jgi:acetyl-CoA C-acetyltransferase
VALGAQHVQLGDARIVVAGGQESMSLSPHVAHLRAGQKMGDLNFIDSMIKDGLWDAFNGYHMGQTAENVANQWQITRDMQDEFALASQNKAEAAQKAGKFKDEIIPFTVKTRKGDTWSMPTNTSATAPRWTRCQAAPGLRQGRHGHGRQCQRHQRRRRRRGADDRGRSRQARLTPLARIASYATAGLDPSIMGVGPIRQPQGAGEGRLEGRRPGSGRGERGLRRPGLRGEQGHGLGSGDRERERRRHRHRPPDRRLGRAHPEHAAVRDGAVGAKKGLATLCIGGGMGVAMCLERG